MNGFALPAMDTKVEIGESKYTRRDVIKYYDPKCDDELMSKSLEFGRICKDAIGGGAFRFIFHDSKMAALEIAAILYFDCLPNNHPIKKQYPADAVKDYVL